MTKRRYVFLIVLGVLLLAWFLYSWLAVRNIEEPRYSVLSTADEYELREYDAYIIAETTVVGVENYGDAANKGFPIVGGYIFGNNTRRDEIAMTTPVRTEEDFSESIAMTVPVNTEAGEGARSYKLSFVMPSAYTLETLPEPNDDRVTIREVPARKVAVHRFSWTSSESSIEHHADQLLTALERDGIETVGTINVARYNPPWTLPFMLRNEIQIEIR